jgi:uncharacterized protein (TIGR03437 family)
VKQRITVQVSDPDQQRWGFELAARLDTDGANGQAGDFTSIDNQTQVICEDNAPKPCASNLLFITHTSAGTRNGTKNGASFQFDWTPPTTNVGTLTMYAAGNAANGNGSPTGDLIYTTSLQLTPAIPVAPGVTSGNVVISATGTAGPATANSWISVYGKNLAVTTRSWNDTDFTDGGLPFSLDGVSVVLTYQGAPRLAYVGYVSPTQVNFVLPSDIGANAAQVQIRNAAGISAPVPLTIQANAPQFLTIDGKHVLASRANGQFVAAAGALSPAITVPAAPGETISLFGTGWGPTTPALVPGQIPTQAAAMSRSTSVTIGGTAATVTSPAVVPNTVGVYQLSVQVPANLGNGDAQVVVSQGGVDSAPVLLTVQK